MVAIWSLKLKLESIITPISFVELKIAKGVSFIKSSFLTSGECDPQMSRLPHLLTDKPSCHFLHYAHSWSSANWNSAREDALLALLYSFKSSEKSLSLNVWSKTPGRSFIKRRKRKGPSTLPCGTPLVTFR